MRARRVRPFFELSKNQLPASTAMDSPRSGFRRAAAASWALTGIGIVGAAGASTLAYADTVKPPPADLQSAPAPEVAPLPPVAATSSVLPPAPTTALPTPEVAPQATTDQAPARTYTPEPTYVPETTVQQAPVTHQAPAPTMMAPRTTQRRALTPTTVMAPNFSPRISRSRGS
jgi:protein TonB